MTQNNIDFSVDPTGSQLLDNMLAGMSSNSNSTNAGLTRPPYAQVGTIWIDTSVEGSLLIKIYDGTNDVLLMTVKNSESVVPKASITPVATTATTATTATSADTATTATNDTTGTSIATQFSNLKSSKADTTFVNSQLATKASKDLPITTLSLTSGSIVLSPETVYEGTISGDTTFVLTDGDPTVHQQIKAFLSFTDDYTINWGTTQFFYNFIPIIKEGSYVVYWDYSPSLDSWVCGAVATGSGIDPQ